MIDPLGVQSSTVAAGFLEAAEIELTTRLEPFRQRLREPPNAPPLRYLAPPELLDALVWNVVIAFLVNLAANWSWERVRCALLRAESRSSSPPSPERLGRALDEVSNLLRVEQVDSHHSPLQPREHRQSPEEEVERVLCAHGFSRGEDTRTLAREIASRLNAALAPHLEGDDHGGMPS